MPLNEKQTQELVEALATPTKPPCEHCDMESIGVSGVYLVCGLHMDPHNFIPYLRETEPPPYQPVIEEQERFPTGTFAKVYPFEDRFTSISAYAEPARGPHAWCGEQYCVNWPSIGVSSTAITRQFAAGLIAACDWVDAKQAEHAAKTKEPQS